MNKILDAVRHLETNSCIKRNFFLLYLIVGAPMWTNYEIMGKYETGRVYIVYQNAEVRMNTTDRM